MGKNQRAFFGGSLGGIVALPGGSQLGRFSADGSKVANAQIDGPKGAYLIVWP